MNLLTALFERLRARGLRVTVRPDGLDVSPPADLTDEDKVALRSAFQEARNPRCPYCHQTSTRCAEIKEQRLDDWRALHSRDPEEVSRRGRKQYDEMMESLRRRGPGYLR